ncbi:1495_t:CDS:2 [Dentiscutata heterogama]|uniref:1495_t:CDS:1 n=1 Tax=Dentiscutata heterogama TaxID=1316150 RepID=A0ACA9KX26_9GLOM|nr:1495_t:CDS:2 [Dentiscutata heterogama]
MNKATISTDKLSEDSFEEGEVEYLTSMKCAYVVMCEVSFEEVEVEYSLVSLYFVGKRRMTPRMEILD